MAVAERAALRPAAPPRAAWVARGRACSCGSPSRRWRRGTTATDPEKFTPHTNAYGSLFYTVNGVHGAHVAAGALLTIPTLLLAFAGRVTFTRNLIVQNVAL